MPDSMYYLLLLAAAAILLILYNSGSMLWYALKVELAWYKHKKAKESNDKANQAQTEEWLR